ncbi:MAG: hypothetical protein KatS3mg121_1179 [Gammaproteobacteria bacterium]|nr:MAG: hypothetical protein KatS3mg121_1179 [Gammaproteobacteria bacterium]
MPEHPVLKHRNLRAFFQESLEQAIAHQRVEVTDPTLTYLVNLLTHFVHAENLFERSAEGLSLKPLALHYRDAIQAPDALARSVALQRLGDCALFIAGFFADYLRRRPVDLDYYIGMGGTAYASLANLRDRRLADAALGEIFAELAEKFVAFVDLLAEIGEAMPGRGDRDLLRLYEIWLRTGSARARRRLLDAGVPLGGRAQADTRH